MSWVLGQALLVLLSCFISNYNTFCSSSSLSEKFNSKVIRWVQSRVSESEQDVGGVRAGGGLVQGDTAHWGLSK